MGFGADAMRVHKIFIGKTYGRLTVLDEAERSVHNGRRFRCQCECGNETVAHGRFILDGKTRSCGCYQRDVVKNGIAGWNKLNSGEAAFNALLGAYAKAAEIRNLEFRLSKEAFRHLTQSRCFYCGVEPRNVTHYSGDNGDYLYNGIDRIDNSLGYLPDNCVTSCKMCNYAKRDYPPDVFYEWAKRLQANLQAKGLV